MKTIESFSEFLRFYNIYPNSGYHYYRGQTDYSWEITPSLARNQNIKNIENITSIERKLIEKFEKRVNNKLDNLFSRISNNYDPIWILLMAAQHYGLPTRLLDFSNDIYSALEFAVADIKHLDKDGALIIYEDVNSIQNDISIFRDHFNNNYHKSFFLQVPIIYCPDNYEYYLSEIRKFIQGSKFLYRDTSKLFNCLSEDKIHSDNVTKFCIPHELKLDIIKFLINTDRMKYDLFAGKNDLDYYALLLNYEFSQLNESNLDDYLKSD